MDDPQLFTVDQNVNKTEGDIHYLESHFFASTSQDNYHTEYINIYYSLCHGMGIWINLSGEKDLFFLCLIPFSLCTFDMYRYCMQNDIVNAYQLN